MEHLVYDLRLALNNLGRRASVSAVIVLTLAVGIACTTAMFSVVRGVLLRPLPWPDSERLAVVWNQPPRSADVLQLSQKEIRDLQELLTGVEIGSYSTQDRPVSFGERTETFAVTSVTREVFEMLGNEVFVGRAFAAEEYLRGGPRTAILSHELWRRAFAADAGVVGTTILVGGLPREIVGVMPPDSPLPLEYESGQRTELWIGTTLGYALEWPRRSRMFYALARFGDHLTPAAAQAELDRALEELRRRHPEVYEAGWKMRLVPVDDEVLGPVRPALLALFGAVFFVLMIACANVAHLLLAQNDARRNEIAVKSALGARRSRLVRQLMLENLALALAGGALGTFGAHGAVDLLLALQPGNLPRIDAVAIDPAVLVFGFAASLATALVFGLLPALKATGRALPSALHRGRGTVGGLRGQGGRRLLMVAEVALATVLLAGAGLLIGTLRNLARADLGFEPRGLVMAGVAVPRGHYDDAAQLLRFWERLQETAARMPGIEATSLDVMAPLFSPVMSRAVEIEAAASGPLEVPRVTIERAGPRIAETMGYRLLKGRDFTAADRAEAQAVALVNEALASHLGEDPIGRRLRIPDVEWVTVVGVIADVVHESLDAPAAPRVLVSYPQFPAIGMRVQGFMWLALRTSGGSELAIEAARAAVRQVDSEVTVTRALPMDDYVAGTALARYRFAAFVLSLFAAVALGLAVVGIYGLLSYLVNRGRREVGVRMALGAKRSDIHRQVSRQGLALVLAGLGLGIPVALGMTRLIETLLYGVTPSEPAAFVATAAALLGVAVLASWLPARRATEVHPIEVLRSE